ncbi:unnamed protein product [Lampetra planeri]
MVPSARVSSCSVVVAVLIVADDDDDHEKTTYNEHDFANGMMLDEVVASELTVLSVRHAVLELSRSGQSLSKRQRGSDRGALYDPAVNAVPRFIARARACAPQLLTAARLERTEPSLGTRQRRRRRRRHRPDAGGRGTSSAQPM